LGRTLLFALALTVPPCPGAPVPRLLAQQRDTSLERSQQRLNEIRRQQQQLQRDLDRLRGRVHTQSTDLTNIERQVDISGRIVGELDLQIITMGSQIERTTAELIVTEDALAEKRAILQHRLTEIHKRGPLYIAQVLLAAESFGDLLSRYKYLYLISRQDRQLVSDVEALRERFADQRNELLTQRTSLGRRRDERTEESERLRTLMQQRQRSLRDSQAEQRRTEQRLQQLARDEARLNDLIASFERRRRAAEAARRAPAAPSRIRTSDIGNLDWPVGGVIVFNFGRQPGPGGGTITRNGIGIGAPVGTPVRSVAAGTVRLAQTVGTYGQTVILDHGGGTYSIYGQLSRMDVRNEQGVERGQTIGLTGGGTADEGPHLYFEIRGEGGRTHVDPVQWLRRRR
jgi:septal ring factor EnvC (AmiA/AmiB activator)